MHLGLFRFRIVLEANVHAVHGVVDFFGIDFIAFHQPFLDAKKRRSSVHRAGVNVDKIQLLGQRFGHGAFAG